MCEKLWTQPTVSHASDMTDHESHSEIGPLREWSSKEVAGERSGPARKSVGREKVRGSFGGRVVRGFAKVFSNQSFAGSSAHTPSFQRLMASLASKATMPSPLAASRRTAIASAFR